MKKAFLIGLKDLRIAARDRAALLLMLAAPFVLTLGLGLITGSLFGPSQSSLQDIPVVLVDQDGGQLARALVDSFTSADLDTLLEPSLERDVEAARAAVEEDRAAAALIIPAGFSASIIPAAASAAANGTSSKVLPVEIYANPARPLSSSVVEAVVVQFLGRVESGAIAGQVAVTQLLKSGLISPQEAPSVGRQLGARAAHASASPVTLVAETLGGARQEDRFNPLAILAPSMAIFFLMYTVTYGGQSLLNERSEWTLQRLLTTPTATASLLGGKVFGIFLTGFAQLLILIFGTSLLFGLAWGDPLAMLVLTAATVLGATGWGLLLAALARTSFQVSNVGTAMMLLFGILGGSFIPVTQIPGFLQTLRLITPNAWALDALVELAQGAALRDVSGAIIALLLMALLLGGAAVLVFRRRQVFA
jgi:ABC-2 type transport system permease protein